MTATTERVQMTHERDGDVLVAIVRDLLDFSTLQEQHWYRIPVETVGRWLKETWPPQWLAFYQPKVFKSEAFAVNYVARVLDIKKVTRLQLFPHDPADERSTKLYYQILLTPLERLPRPIVSLRWRRILFIATTWHKLVAAQEINDLYHGSPLEESLWTEFKRRRIPAERQEEVILKRRSHFLDFAVYCAQGKLDVETDGDTWHANPQAAEQDNLRDNGLKTCGWQVLRFNGHSIREQMQDYCLPTIADNINRMGGLAEGKIVSRRIDLSAPPGTYQMSLLDDL